MKTSIKTLVILISFCTLLSCEDKPVPPVLSTNSITSITTTSAISGGNVTDDGGAAVISRGVCWNTDTDPDITNSKTSEGGGSGSFTSNIIQLTPGTTYFVRAYATNSAGTSYGSSVSFKTLGDKPSSISTNATDILTTSVILSGTVNPNSLTTTVTFEYGLTTEYGSTSTAVQSPLSGDSNGSVSSNLTALSPGKVYHFRIKAENSLGVTYSSDMTFTTLGQVPLSTIKAAANIQLNSVTLNGSVNPNYLSSTVIFEWGTTISYGNSITPAQSPLTGNAALDVSADLSGLTSGTLYHFRLKAANELGSVYSGDMTFTTQEIEWTKPANFPGVGRSLPLSFTYNGKGYFGLGRNSINPATEDLKDFWTFDPGNSTWTRLNDCPFTFINGLTSRCLVGSILYVFKEWALYSYDLNNDTWQFVCNSPNSLFSISCFSVNNTAFFFNKSNSELYEFHPNDNTFTKKAALIDGFSDWGLSEAFVINNEVFMLHKNNTMNEIYHYLTQSDRWELKLEKGIANPAFTQASFIITNNNSAFIGQSTSLSFSSLDDNAIVTPSVPSSVVWKYDNIRNEFKEVSTLPGEFRAQSGCFSFDNFGYVISGVTVDPNTHLLKYLSDMWILKW